MQMFRVSLVAVAAFVAVGTSDASGQVNVLW